MVAIDPPEAGTVITAFGGRPLCAEKVGPFRQRGASGGRALGEGRGLIIPRGRNSTRGQHMATCFCASSTPRS